jgi:hypothetical protein
VIRRHPLIVKTEAILSSLRPDEYGMLRTRRSACLDIRVSPRRLLRALRIMNRVLAKLGAMGSKVLVTVEEKPQTIAIVDGQTIPFSLRETAKRSDHVPSKSEAEASKERRYRTYHLWDFRPTGCLTLEIGHWGFWGVRTIWNDRQDERLEVQIDSFVEGMKHAAVRAREVEEQRVQERRAREVEQERLLMEQRRREAERQRIDELKRQAESLRQSRLIHDLIEEVRRRENGLLFSGADDSPLAAWLSWAAKCADELDPVTGIVERCRPAPSKPMESDDQVAHPDGVAGASGNVLMAPQTPSGNLQSRRLDRNTLYQQVWSRPVQVVAKDYRISGRGLAKACARLRVPVPPRGYWARVRNGHKEKRPPLPPTIRGATLG